MDVDDYHKFMHFLFSGATAQRRATYQQGTGPILLDQVQCYGNESSVFDCNANPIGQHDCTHSKDAGITCSAGIKKIIKN